ncbi:hypothetical protein SNEBB_001724 [Seison nebaliae]|nr:hypothetical protein SNEBB_001724 [Seison nebaliae]
MLMVTIVQLNVYPRTTFSANCFPFFNWDLISKLYVVSPKRTDVFCGEIHARRLPIPVVYSKEIVLRYENYNKSHMASFKFYVHQVIRKTESQSCLPGFVTCRTNYCIGSILRCSQLVHKYLKYNCGGLSRGTIVRKLANIKRNMESKVNESDLEHSFHTWKSQARQSIEMFKLGHDIDSLCSNEAYLPWLEQSQNMSLLGSTLYYIIRLIVLPISGCSLFFYIFYKLIHQYITVIIQNNTNMSI